MPKGKRSPALKNIYSRARGSQTVELKEDFSRTNFNTPGFTTLLLLLFGSYNTKIFMSNMRPLAHKGKFIKNKILKKVDKIQILKMTGSSETIKPILFSKASKALKYFIIYSTTSF